MTAHKNALQASAQADGQSAHRADRCEKDLRTLARFIEVYCKGLHDEVSREPVQLKVFDAQMLAGHELILCEDCTKLLAHALVKRTHCPMDPKPQCKHCPNHCYAPKYRQQIREVMRYSGKKILFSGRIDYLYHLLF